MYTYIQGSVYSKRPGMMAIERFHCSAMYLYTGEGDEKGKVMGIFRSLGALARALGPATACTGKLPPPFLQEKG